MSGDGSRLRRSEPRRATDRLPPRVASAIPRMPADAREPGGGRRAGLARAWLKQAPGVREWRSALRSAGVSATSRSTRNFRTGRVLEPAMGHGPSLKLVAVAVAAMVPTIGASQAAYGADTVP